MAGGMWDIETWNILSYDAGYFVNESESGDHLVGSAGYPIPGDPATSVPRVETGLPSRPAQSRQSWVTFVFSRRPWKVLAAQAGLGLAGYIMATWSNKNRRKGDDYDFPLTFH